MSDAIISVERIGKRYRIQHAAGGGYRTFREALMRGLSAPFRSASGDAHAAAEDFWALRDLSFDVRRGEVVGIIGRNGAGKSTLLKILSRITEPTEGRVRLRGCVASLLEVGTGFHPELTGRENIYLNGAILGMLRTEIARKFDEIVAFAETEQFLDTPVKRYSSGMYVRLAFAVAAHLEPEVLIVDEVLAVGDSEFQRKCLGKMQEVSEGGRTVLFVSHNMGAVQRLCDRAVILDRGRLVFEGPTDEAVARYGQLGGRGTDPGSHMIYSARAADQRQHGQVVGVDLRDANGDPKPVVRTWDEVVIHVTGSCDAPVPVAAVEIEIESEAGDRLLRLSSQPDSNTPLSLPAGVWSVECRIPQLPLAAGRYMASFSVTRPNVEFLWRSRDAALIEVHPRDVFASGMAPALERAPLAVPHQWRLLPSDTDRHDRQAPWHAASLDVAKTSGH